MKMCWVELESGWCLARILSRIEKSLDRISMAWHGMVSW